MFNTLDCSPVGTRVWEGERKEIKKTMWPKQAIMHSRQSVGLSAGPCDNGLQIEKYKSTPLGASEFYFLFVDSSEIELFSMFNASLYFFCE